MGYAIANVSSPVLSAETLKGIAKEIVFYRVAEELQPPLVLS